MRRIWPTGGLLRLIKKYYFIMHFLYHAANKHEIRSSFAEAVCVSEKCACRIFKYNGGTVPKPRIILFSQTKKNLLESTAASDRI